MTRTMSRRNVLTGLGMVGLGGVARAAGAQDPVPPPTACPVLRPPLPGTFGLLGGQVARLAVVNQAYSQDPNNPAGIAIPPFAVAEIIGADGIALASKNAPPLGPNEAWLLDFEYPVEKSAGGRDEKSAGGRLELFGLVRYAPGLAIGSSLQIVDSSSGETLYPTSPCAFQDPALGGQVANPTPVGWPLGGTVGLVTDQILRVSMVHHEHDPDGIVSPCDIVADVFDAQGQLLVSKSFGNPKNHEAVFLDLPHPGGKGPRRDTRLEVSVRVRFTPGHHVGGSVQVIDANTGQTIGGSVTPCLIEDSTVTPW